MKRISIRKIGQLPNKNLFRYKIVNLTLIFTVLFSIVLFIKDSGYFADVVNYSSSLLGKDVLITKLEDMKDSSASWPLKQVTNWAGVTNYEETKWTDWNTLSDDLKTSFPMGDLFETISKYQNVNLYNMYDLISNPSERKLLTFYRRLIGATWTADYCSNKDNCNSWILNSGTHAGVDFISSLNTPVYASMNGVVLKSCSANCDAFGNQIVIATDFNGQMLATFYAHLNGIRSGLTEGTVVKKGDLIGYMGNSGNSTVPHLHFQINKLGNTSEIRQLNVAQKLYDGWYHNMEGVKKSTLNPIYFVQTNKIQVDDSFVNNVIVNDQITNTSSLSSSSVSSVDFIDQIATVVESDVSSSQSSSEVVLDKPDTKPFKIVSVKSNKIDNKLTKGDTITITVVTQGTDGAISVSSDNNVLVAGQYVLSPGVSDTYSVNITANSIGNGQVIFNDGYDKKTLFFSVYDTDMNVYGLQINGANTVYSSYETEFLLYPIDKLGNRVYTNLNGTFSFDIIDKDSKKSYKVTQFYNDSKDSSIVFKVKAPGLGNYKLKVSYDDNKKTLMATKNLGADIFFDYSVNDKFGKNINTLLGKGIVKGHEGLLMPYNKISRAEIITLLVRNRYGDNLSLFEKEMKSYMQTNGRFFKDIQGDEWFAPYLYIGFKNNILEGTNNKALPYDYITKAELVALLGRAYNVSSQDLFMSWNDVAKEDWFKKYADAAKKYNLYPSDNLDYFKPYDLVNRLETFETMYRYMNINITALNYSTVSPTNQDQQLEMIMSNLIKF